MHNGKGELVTWSCSDSSININDFMIVNNWCLNIHIIGVRVSLNYLLFI